MTFDWRMDRQSWFMIAFIFITMVSMIVIGANGMLGFAGLVQAILYGALTTFVLIAISCIPVVIYCYFIKKIPDIDYAVWMACAFTVVGIISEFIF